ncbi:hypothetical protein [Pedobacter faecalis]|uniref:hypothetical protein n=1 Tax=Pedobacter faecalis TaxID=3041495 RepID=UPI003F58D12B
MLPEAFNGIWSFDRDKTRIAFEKDLLQSEVPANEVFAKATRLMENKLVEEMKEAVRKKRHFVL